MHQDTAYNKIHDLRNWESRSRGCLNDFDHAIPSILRTRFRFSGLSLYARVLHHWGAKKSDFHEIWTFRTSGLTF